MKDANDLLKAGRLKDITQAVYGARAWRPGGIVSGRDLWDRMTTSAIPGRPYPFAFLNSMRTGLGGVRPGTIVTWVSGTGMGKSTLVRELGYADLMAGLPVGDVRLEEGVGQTGLGYVGLHLGKRLMLEGFDPGDPAIRKAFEETIGSKDFYTLDHFGSLDDGDLLGKLRYLAAGCGCRTEILDHISIVVSGMDETGDERRTIDRLMTALRSLAENTGVTLHAICHLKRTQGTSHEEGGRITLADLRGSQAIAQLSDAVVALERNQQAEDEDEKATTLVRSLKCRATGYTGVMGYLRYDPETGRMKEVPAPEPKQENKRAPRRKHDDY